MMTTLEYYQERYRLARQRAAEAHAYRKAYPGSRAAALQAAAIKAAEIEAGLWEGRAREAEATSDEA